jgi:hypothetical protein
MVSPVGSRVSRGWFASNTLPRAPIRRFIVRPLSSTGRSVRPLWMMNRPESRRARVDASINRPGQIVMSVGSSTSRSETLMQPFTMPSAQPLALMKG